MPYRILVADDEPGFRSVIQKALSLEPWVVDTAEDGCKALDLLCQGRFDLAILDIVMPHIDGLEILRIIRKKGIQTDVIVLTGYGDIDLAVEAMKLGALDFVEKQKLNLLEFIATVRRLLESRHLPPHIIAKRLDAYLQEHLSNSSLTLRDLCRYFNLSRSYVSLLFQKHLGPSFRERLAWHRVQKAKHLLRSTDRLLEDIAEECGFKHRTRLTEAFIRLERIPPQKYRENLWT